MKGADIFMKKAHSIVVNCFRCFILLFTLALYIKISWIFPIVFGILSIACVIVLKKLNIKREEKIITDKYIKEWLIQYLLISAGGLTAIKILSLLIELRIPNDKINLFLFSMITATIIICITQFFEMRKTQKKQKLNSLNNNINKEVSKEL
jgi:uncharacterized paraquat-inducible protein A